MSFWSSASPSRSAGFMRLLDHEQVEVVQLAEPRNILGRVGSVRVDHERNDAEMLPDRADQLDVVVRAGS